MTIIVRISQEGTNLAEITYRSGMLVEVRVEEQFRSDRVNIVMSRSDNRLLSGEWDQALDDYFNEQLFDSKDTAFPGEMRRVGAAREHKSLFRQAVRLLQKSLEPHGYEIKVMYP